jgi:hypothetical protein
MAVILIHRVPYNNRRVDINSLHDFSGRRQGRESHSIHNQNHIESNVAQENLQRENGDNEQQR